MTLIGTTWLVQAIEFLADLRERIHRNMICLTVDCKSHAVWDFLADVRTEWRTVCDNRKVLVRIRKGQALLILAGNTFGVCAARILALCGDILP